MSTVTPIPPPPVPSDGSTSGSSVAAFEFKGKQNDRPRLLRRAAAIALFLLFVVITPFALWIVNIDRVAMNPDTYKSAVSTQNFYSSVLPGLTKALVDGNGREKNSTVQNNLRVLDQNLSEQDWHDLSDRLLPPNWLENQIKFNIENGFDWLNGSESLPEFHFDNTQLKDRLTNADLQETITLLLTKLPACTPEQLRAITNADPTQPNGMNNFLICHPQEQAVQDHLIAVIGQLANGVGQQMPSYFDFQEDLQRGNSGNFQQAEISAGRLRALISLANRLIFLLLLIPVVLISLIVILTIRSSKVFFRWMGWASIISGFLGLLPIPFTSGLPTFFNVNSTIQQGIKDSNPLFVSMFSGIVGSVTSQLSTALLLQVAIIIALGLVALIVSVLLTAPEPDLGPEVVPVQPVAP